jgi:hypothetical protein
MMTVDIQEEITLQRDIIIEDTIVTEDIEDHPHTKARDGLLRYNQDLITYVKVEEIM